MFFKKILKMFNRGSVCVTGLRGTGKDMLMSNVIARRKASYISNMDYKVPYPYIPLDFEKIDPKNNYQNFIAQEYNYYDYPYPKGIDIYVSDCGVYFPSQFCGELNKMYKNFPVFQALCRQLGRCNFHINSQNLNRVWDKIREQSDLYIRCLSCRVLFHKIVFQRIIIYDKYDSCVNRVQPFKPIRAPLLARKEARALYMSKNEELKRSFFERNGLVKKGFLIYVNKSSYDTYYFDKLLRGELNVVKSEEATP